MKKKEDIINCLLNEIYLKIKKIKRIFFFKKVATVNKLQK